MSSTNLTVTSLASRALRVAIVCEFPTLLGGEQSLLATLRVLAARAEWSFVVIAPPEGAFADALQSIGVTHLPWDPLQTRQTAGPLAVEHDLRERLHSASADLVHANSLAMGRLLGRLQPELSCPTTAHLRDMCRLSAQACRELNRHGALVAVSAATRDYHQAQGVDPQRMHVVHNGIDLTQFAPRDFAVTDVAHPAMNHVPTDVPPGPSNLSAEFGLPPETRWVLNVGQICLRKGQADFVHAALAVAERHPDVHFALIGARASQKTESREYEAALHQSVAESAVADRVHFLGTRNDVPQLLREATVLLHTAYQEPLGRVLLEAMASGLPIIATDVGGTRELLPDAQHGLLVPAGNLATITEALHQLLNDPPRQCALAQAARLRVQQHFDVTRQAEQLSVLWQMAAHAADR